MDILRLLAEILGQLITWALVICFAIACWGFLVWLSVFFLRMFGVL